MKASIRRSTNNTYIALAEDGKLYSLKIKGKVLTSSKAEYNPISVGDIVNFTPHSENEGLINSREERKSEFTRFLNKVALIQCTCSNMDQAVIVSSLKSPEFNSHFIDRVIASIRGCDIVIAINKSDLGLDNEKEEIDLYERLGYEVCLVSAKKGDVRSLLPLLKNKVSTFIGPSGVGKSSLINLILNKNQKVGDINEKYNRGKHTTTSALYLENEDIAIIDTPGIREVIPAIDSDELKYFYPEFKNCECKYSNCLHSGEDGCAVSSLIENGIMSERRYDGYLNLLFDIKNAEKKLERIKWQA